MKRTIAVIAAALTLLGMAATGLLAGGCGGGGSSGMPSDAVATVGDATITQAQLDTLLTQAKAQIKSQGAAFPAAGTAAYHRYVAQIVDYLVQAQIIAQSAKSFGVSVTDQQVADQVAQIEEANGGRQKVVKILAKQGMTLALLEQSIKDQLLARGVAAKVVKGTALSPAQVQAYWRSHKAQLVKNKQTATFAKAKASIEQLLLSQQKQKLWTAWIDKRRKELGVRYATDYDPARLVPSPSASASPGG